MFRTSLLTALLTAVQFAGWVQAQERVALVIGNNNYQNASWGSLANPINDADDIATTLYGLGFQVTVKHDVNEREMKKTVTNFRKNIISNNTKIAIFFYAGHGAEVEHNNYLIPIDAEDACKEEIQNSAVEVDELLKQLTKGGAHTTVMILDACRDTAVKCNRSGTNIMANKDYSDYPRTLVAYSTRSGGVASDGVARNSPYTTALLQQLKIPNQSLLDIFNNVDVPKQQPKYTSSPGIYNGYLLAQETAANARWHALVVGADVYEYGRLNDAINDAKGIADALRKNRIFPTVLLAEKARYDTIHSWWDDTNHTIVAGDLIFFSFSGYGACKKKITMESSEKKEDVIVLPGYQDKGSASNEYIAKDEIIGWALQAIQKGAIVFIIIDSGPSCQSSSMIEPEQLRLYDSINLENTAIFQSHLFYIWSNLSKEMIDDNNGEAHGVLSYLVTKALRGEAVDESGRVLITVGELRKYFRTEGRKLSEQEGDIKFFGVDMSNKDTQLIPSSAQ